MNKWFPGDIKIDIPHSSENNFLSTTFQERQQIMKASIAPETNILLCLFISNFTTPMSYIPPMSLQRVV